MRAPWLPVLILAASIAAPAPAQAERPAAGHPVAVAVNAPWGWALGSFGVSAYVALGRHHGLRGNVARYESSEPVVPAVIGVLRQRYTKAQGGQMFDVGAAWVWYPRRPWDGPTLEAGLLRRDRDTWTSEEADARVETESTSYGARAMVGWSWMIRGRVFIAIAVGASIQRESGSDTITPDGIMPMSKTRSIARTRIDEEGYLRVGFAFGG